MNYSVPKRILFSLIISILTLSANITNAQCPTAVSITAPASKFCPGGNITLTANVTGGPNDLKYEWRNFGVPVGGNTSTLVITQSGFYTVKVTDTVNICSKTSSAFVASVSPTTNISLSGLLNFCSGNNVILSVDSSENYTFQWKLNGSNISGATFSDLTVTSGGNYTVDVTDNSPGLGCTATSDIQAVTVDPITIAGTLNGTAAICIGETASALTLTGYTGNIIRWESSTNGGSSWSPIAHTTDTYNPGEPTQTTQYRAVVQSGTCASANSNTVTITVNPLPIAAINITSGTANFCSGGSATLSNSNGTSYVWKESGNPIGGATNSTHIVTTSGNYTVTVTDANGCVATTSSPTVITVDAPTVAGSVSGGSTICSGSTSAQLTLAGYTGNILGWVSSTDAGSTWDPIANTINTYTSAALSSTTIFKAVVQSGSCLIDSSTSTTVTVDAAPVGGSISGGSTICSGSTPSQLTLSGQIGNIVKWQSSTSPFSSWTDIANTSTTHTPSSLTETTRYRAVIGNGVCADVFSSTVDIIVDQPITITSQPVSVTKCAGTSHNFTVSATGAISAYQWKYNGVNISGEIADNLTKSNISIADTGSYTVEVQAVNCPSVLSNAAQLSVNVPSTPIIQLVVGSNPFCDGQSITIRTASTWSGYQWKKDGSNLSLQTNRNLIVTAAGSYEVVTTDVNGCNSTSAPYAVTVNPTPSASISASGNTNICNGDSVILTNASGGTYQWIANGFDIPGATSNSYTVKSSGDYTVRVTSASGCTSTTSPATTVTVSPATVGGLTSGAATTVCSGSNSPLLTLSGNTGTVIRWESSVNGGASWQTITHTGTTYTSGPLTQTTQFRAVVQSGGCPEANSFDEEITVTPPSVGGSVSGSKTICTGSNTGTLSLSGNTGNVVRWEKSVSPFSSWTTISNTALTHSENGLTQTTWYRAVVQNTAFCSEAFSDSAVVQVDNVPTFSTNPISQSICEGSPVTFTATATSINPVLNYQWKKNNVDIIGQTTNSYTINSVVDGVAGDEADYTVVAVNACGTSLTSSVATLTVNTLPNATISDGGAPNTFCSGGNITLTASGGNTYQWKKDNVNNATTNPFVATVTGKYNVVATDGNGCVSDTSAPVFITVNPLPDATITESGSLNFCAGGSVTLSNTNGVSYVWNESGNPIGGATNNSFIANTSGSYTVTVTDANNCSATSASPSVVVVDAPTVAGAVSGGTIKCEGDNSGVLTLSGNTGSVLNWESAISPFSTWSSISNTSNTLTSSSLSQTTAFRAVVKNGQCNTLESDTTIVTIDPATVGGTVSGGSTICANDNSGLLTLSGHTGNIIRWESSTDVAFTSPTTIANTNNTYTANALTTSTYFRAVVKSGVCNEQASASTLVTVINAPSISSQPTSASRCVGTSVTFSVTASGATGYQWYLNGNPIVGANTSSYNIANVGLADAGDYEVVLSNSCVPTTTSVTATLTVNTLPNATISDGGAPNTFCSGGNITLTASGGNTYQWKKDNVNNATTNPFVATVTGKYNVVATDGNGCVSDTSAPVFITVNPLPDATITESGSLNFCAGGSVTLSNTNGVSYVWNESGNPIGGATNNSFIANTSGSYTVTVTDANNCSATSASPSVVVVDAPTVAGAVSGGTNVCEGSTSGTLTLAGQTGTVEKWQFAPSPFSSWTDIAHTNTNYISGALSANTAFRAIVKNGTCLSVASDSTVVTITPSSIGGSVSGGTTPICSGNAPGTLTLSGETGGVIRWESAESPFATWNLIANSTTSLIPGNLTTTTRYRAVVKNGVCSETNSNHQEIIVNQAPSITSQPTSVERCVGGNVTFSVTAADAVSYQWKKGASDITGEINSTLNLTNLTLGDAGDYTVVITNTCGNTTSNTATLTINTLPTAGSSAGGSTTFCSGSNVSLTATGGTTYQWRKDGANFSTSNPLIVTSAGSYDVFAISDKGCTSISPATAIVVAVNNTPNASISPSGSVQICAGNSETLTASGGTSYQWKKDGVDIATGTTYAANAAGSYTVVAIENACSSAVSTATTITLTPAGTWLGTIDDDPNNTANWSCGTIPTASTVVDISSGNNPNLGVGKSIVANGITIGAGKTINVNGGTLRIQGSISGSGNINNTSGEVEFFGSTNQTIPSGLFQGNTAAKIKITNSGTVNLSGPLSITERLTCEDGVFATNGNLTLKSNASGTAIVDALTPDASITGNVTVERYIPASARRWRFMAAPINGGTLADWKDDIFITGTGGLANGFDATSNNAPSVYYYNEATTGNLNQGWTAAPNTSMSFTVGRGYRVFIRGDRSDPGRLTGATTTQNEVTIEVSGTLNQQTINMPVTYTNTGSSTDDGWNLLGNPFAAPFDWGAMWRTGNSGFTGTFYNKIRPEVYVYDPVGNNYKSYNAATSGGTLTDGIIAPGQAFFIKATGTSPTLQFYESFKSTSTNNSLFKTGSTNDELIITMRSDSLNYDQFILKFKSGATVNDDLYDIGRMNNGANDIYSFGSDNVPHSLDARPQITTASDTIKLYTGGTNGLHTFTFNKLPAATGLNYYLKDNYLNSVTPIVLNGVYSFNINSSNAATFGNNRFRIIIENTNVLPVTVSKFTAKLNNETQAVLNWTTATEKNSSRFEVEHSLDNINFKKLGTVKARGNSNVQVNYEYTDAGFVKGMVNYYRLKIVDIDNTYSYSGVRQVSKDNTIQSTVADYVFMAPIPTEDYVKIWSDVEVLNGGAEVKIYDTHMKLIITKTIQGFGKLNEQLDLTSVEQGIYIIQIKDENNEWIVTRKVVKN